MGHMKVVIVLMKFGITLKNTKKKRVGILKNEMPPRMGISCFDLAHLLQMKIFTL
jgi:hypothetical protein